MRNLPLSDHSTPCSSTAPADEQGRVLGEEVNAESKENVCLKRRKEDFGEAMRLLEAERYEI